MRAARIIVFVGGVLASAQVSGAPQTSTSVDATHQYSVAIPPSLAGAPVPGSPPADEQPPAADTSSPARLVARWLGPAGTTVSVARVDGPGGQARRRRSTFIDQFEAGIRRHARRFRQRSRRVDRIGGVPVLDLSFVYAAGDGERMAVTTRTLFFRRYTLTLTISVPARRERKIRRLARRLTRSFVPHIVPQLPATSVPSQVPATSAPSQVPPTSAASQ